MLAGFVVLGVVILVGYLTARTGVLGPDVQSALSRVAFTIASPALLFETLAHADVGTVFSKTLVVVSVTALSSAVLFAVIGAIRRWGVTRTTVGALASSQLNAGNLGVPITVYVLGDATAVAPVVLFQQLVLVPVGLTVLDLVGPRAGGSVWARLGAPFRNPVLLASAAGLAVSAAGWTLPPLVLDPIEVIGGLAVPTVLLAYGMSLRGSPLPGRGPDRAPLLLASVLKLVVAPLVAWGLGVALDLSAEELLAVVVLSALPTAQALFTYAVTYRSAVELAREAITVTTVGSVPVLLVIAALLG